MLLCSCAKAQQVLPDSLKKAVDLAKDDSSLFKALRHVYTFYEETNRDSALNYAEIRYEIVKKHNRSIEESYLLGQIAYQQIFLGRFSEALTNLTTAFQIAENTKDADTWELTPFNTPGKSRQITLSMLNHMYGHLKIQTGDTAGLNYFKEGRRIGLEIGNDFRVVVADMVLAMNYVTLQQTDSALLYAKEGEVYGIRGGINKYLSNIYSVMGDIYRQRRNDSLVLTYYHRSLQYAIAESNFSVVAYVYESLANYYYTKNNADSMLLYAKKNIAVIKSLGAVTSFVTRDINLGKGYQDMAMAYSLKKYTDSSNAYLQLALNVKDSITAIKLKRLAAFQRLTLNEQVRLQNEEKERVAAETRRKTYLLIAGIVVALIIILLIYRNNRQKQKANLLLKDEKHKVEIALSELKSTQQQLIQSEKMASLGELTAGIAHEIQNPLNFVNNFSEVSNELIDEMNIELNKGDIEEAKAISSDIKQNLEKINHHGKRAEAIVKGMLQHSQKGTGKKEATNINALVDEYLRLSYHGFRSKEKEFNAEIKTDFDKSIDKINIVPQDIGRVLLNLFNNAFYAVNEKKKTADENYKPFVSVQTKKINNAVEIIATDNGNGIPSNIKEKIFQPFFTTKPTGQGTGLGLSLSYDIVKAHGGKITVESKESDGLSAEALNKTGITFIIQLPII